ncbi:hypothetical protein SS50377_25138 [Spironucleus salmonicida]|uniref:Uncharacterized protein n=1 Tax=Spironucleus salmonicida TaxID=348837 RepID=A0A9P8RXW0_9EUKA|nr:hypothetical protein SS50377_25138 [Spironucleus salmonicida]
MDTKFDFLQKVHSEYRRKMLMQLNSIEQENESLKQKIFLQQSCTIDKIQEVNLILRYSRMLAKQLKKAKAQLADVFIAFDMSLGEVDKLHTELVMIRECKEVEMLKSSIQNNRKPSLMT